MLEIYNYNGREGTLGISAGQTVFNYSDGQETDFLTPEDYPLLKRVRIISDRESLSEPQCASNAQGMREECASNASVMREECASNASVNDLPDNDISVDDYIKTNKEAVKLLNNSNFIKKSTGKYKTFLDLPLNTPGKLVEAINDKLGTNYTIRKLSPVVVAMRINDRVAKPKVFFIAFVSFFIPASLCYFLVFGLPNPKVATIEKKEIVQIVATPEEIKLTKEELEKIDEQITITSSKEKKKIYPYRRGLIVKACQDLKNIKQLNDATIKTTVKKFVDELI